MNPIIKAVDEVKYGIPPQILREVFSPRANQWRNNTPVSIDEQIIALVIRPRVLVDCNLVGGSEVLIPLDGYLVERFDAFTATYFVPKSATDGRSIMSVLSVGYASTSLQGLMGGMGGVKPCSVTPTNMAGMAMMDAMSPIPVASSARAQLVAENTIRIRDVNPLISNAFIRVVLANDDQLSHIQMRSIPAFCRLALLAVKSYIYNESILRIDQAQLSGGMDLGKFKEIVEEYRDSDELYKEFLEKQWSGISTMNDHEAYTRLIKLGVGAMR